MSASPPVVEALEKVLQFLAARGIEYMVIGGLAVRVLALPRTTFDVDLVVAVGEAEVARFALAAEDAGFVVDEAFRRGFIDRLGGLGKIHFHVPVAERMVRVDAFVLASEYQRAAFARRREHPSDVGPLAVVAAEDLLLHKLIANRPRDRADVADLLLVVGGLDREYLQAWAPRLGVHERLSAALREAGRDL